jgi:hypothetical protein
MATNTGKSPGEIFGRFKMIYPNGDSFGWRDIEGVVTTRGVGATDPDWAQIGSSAFYAYSFSLNDTCWINYHIPHDIVPNAPVHFHCHWLTDGTNVNPVKWQFQYTYAKGFNQAAYNVTGTTVTAEEAPPGVAYQHMVTETAAQEISGLTEPDGIIQCRITRIANGATDNTDTIFLLEADVHYQSSNQATYDKAPNFYGV